MATHVTSNRPLEDWGKLIGDVPAATAILDRFLHHAAIIEIRGKSHRLRNQGRANEVEEEPAPEKAKQATAKGGAHRPKEDDATKIGQAPIGIFAP